MNNRYSMLEIVSNYYLDLFLLLGFLSMEGHVFLWHGRKFFIEKVISNFLLSSNKIRAL